MKKDYIYKINMEVIGRLNNSFEYIVVSKVELWKNGLIFLTFQAKTLKVSENLKENNNSDWDFTLTENDFNTYFEELGHKNKFPEFFI